MCQSGCGVGGRSVFSSVQLCDETARLPGSCRDFHLVAPHREPGRREQTGSCSRQASAPAWIRESLSRLSAACRRCLCPTWTSSHQVCAPREAACEALTNLEAFHEANADSSPRCNTEGPTGPTEDNPCPHGGARCFKMAMSVDPISRTPALHHVGLPSSGSGDRPTIHRLVGLRPFSVSNITQSPHGVGFPSFVGCSAGGGSTSGRASSIAGGHTLSFTPFTPFARRPSGTTHLRHAIIMPPAPSREDLHGDAPP